MEQYWNNHRLWGDIITLTLAAMFGLFFVCLPLAWLITKWTAEGKKNKKEVLK